MLEKVVQVRSILVPLDGSIESEKALPWAVEMAARQYISITL